MDLIAAHRLGLVEQLEVEAHSLAGRPGDLVQRAIVQIHLFDHSGGRHGYALLGAGASLALDDAVGELRRAAKARTRWRRAGRAALLERVEGLAAALKSIDRERCEALVLAYRLMATPGLGSEARERLDPALAEALAALRAGRDDDGSAAERWSLFDAHDLWLDARFGVRVDDAVAALDWPGRPPRALAALLALVRIPPSSWQRAERTGWQRLAARTCRHPALPAGFAANPGQHYYRLQRTLAERRRRARSEGLDLALGDTVNLAA